MQRDLRDFVVTFLPALCLAIARLLSIREVAFRVWRGRIQVSQISTFFGL